MEGSASEPDELSDSEVLFLGMLAVGLGIVLLGLLLGLLDGWLGMLLMGLGAQVGVLTALPLLWALVRRRGRLHRSVALSATAVYGLVAAIAVGARLS